VGESPFSGDVRSSRAAVPSNDVLIFVAIALLFILPEPWNWIACLATGVLWGVELFIWNRTVRSRRKAVGSQTLIGRIATVSATCDPEGQVRLEGETWHARCAGVAALGEQVRVVGREKLTLLVEPASRQADSETGVSAEGQASSS
jgi:membrane protein implicated in regulation of membrane protease activity